MGVLGLRVQPLEGVRGGSWRGLSGCPGVPQAASPTPPPASAPATADHRAHGAICRAHQWGPPRHVSPTPTHGPASHQNPAPQGEGRVLRRPHPLPMGEAMAGGVVPLVGW